MPILNYPFRLISEFSSPKPLVPLTITNPHNGIDTLAWALIDTGADETVIPDFIAKAIYHDIENQKVEKSSSIGIGGLAVSYLHTFQLEILKSDQQGTVGGTAIKLHPRKYAVVKGLHIIILGEDDFLKDFILTINYPEQIFSLKKP